MRRTSHASPVATFVVALGVVFAGCLTRPVVSNAPVTKSDITTVINNSPVEKLDLLFVIDNSASMGDKQDYLSRAVPDLITRLVTPNCIDPVSGTVFGPSDASGNGACAQGRVEFPPAHDMHIGVMSTSLGPRLGDQLDRGSGLSPICDPSQTVTVGGVTFNAHNDDRGELLNRAGPAETPLADAGTSFYLNFFPATNPKNVGKSPSAGAPPIQTPTQLIATSLIKGVGNYGCGIESQLESWYRFLVQPDPYDSLAVVQGAATWQGVDTTILRQRHDFLRPDSLVAIVDLTDENDSEVDIRSLNGSGWHLMASSFEPPRGTSSCAENSSNSGLVDPGSCAQCPAGSSDPTCALGLFVNANDWGFNANLRHVHPLQKYGVIPQFPIQRYLLGLTSKRVPDRSGEYPAGAGSYQGLTNLNCTNPLFAASLPDGSQTDPATLCDLPPGRRTPDLVYYAHIGGVPHQLLQEDPTNPDSAQKETLDATDWQKILGSDPLNYDYSGIDPHMLESYRPRAGIPFGPGPAPDPASGYDWITDQGDLHVLPVDREYACTFPLAAKRDCSCGGAAQCTDPNVSYACDCPLNAGLTPQQLPPICDPNNPTQQVAAKAYPTQRELLLAMLMKGQGFVSSLCPIHVQPASGRTELTDPLFGYNPAVNGIVDRLEVDLSGPCVPQKLVPDAQCGSYACLVLVSMNDQADASDKTRCKNPGAVCDPSKGLLVPPPTDADAVAKYCDAQESEWQASMKGPEPYTVPVCEMRQLFPAPPGGQASGCPAPAPAADFAGPPAGSCASSPEQGWCYVTGAAAGQCGHQVLFTSAEPPAGSTVWMQCIEQSVTVVDARGN